MSKDAKNATMALRSDAAHPGWRGCVFPIIDHVGQLGDWRTRRRSELQKLFANPPPRGAVL
jgi:hypothetical protein